MESRSEQGWCKTGVNIRGSTSEALVLLVFSCLHQLCFMRVGGKTDRTAAAHCVGKAHELKRYKALRLGALRLACKPPCPVDVLVCCFVRFDKCTNSTCFLRYTTHQFANADKVWMCALLHTRAW
eukprot:1158687-Pelagomonas_calceolata.AAC.2